MDVFLKSELSFFAGIAIHITFHCFRPTFATLQLLLGTDIVTVSKMLGHKNIKTTMIYVKITVNRLKREASHRNKINFGADLLLLNDKLGRSDLLY